MARKSVYMLALAGLMSSSMYAGDGLEKGFQMLGLLVGGGYSLAVYQDAHNEFKKSKSTETSFYDDVTRVAGVCFAVPLTVGLLMGTTDGVKALTNTAVAGSVFLVINRMVESHDTRFWPWATGMFLYSLGKAAAKASGLPVHDFAG